MANVETKYLVIGRDKSYFVKHHSGVKGWEVKCFNAIALITGLMTPGGYNTPPADPVIVIKRKYLI
jgi:hypothetical protein